MQVVSQVPAVAVLQESGSTPTQRQGTRPVLLTILPDPWVLGSLYPPWGRCALQPMPEEVNRGTSRPLDICGGHQGTQCGSLHAQVTRGWCKSWEGYSQAQGTHLHDQVDRIGHFLQDTEDMVRGGGDAPCPHSRSPPESPQPQRDLGTGTNAPPGLQAGAASECGRQLSWWPGACVPGLSRLVSGQEVRTSESQVGSGILFQF